jgi:hypothetical protein
MMAFAFIVGYVECFNNCCTVRRVSVHATRYRFVQSTETRVTSTVVKAGVSYS